MSFLVQIIRGKKSDKTIVQMLFKMGYKAVNISLAKKKKVENAASMQAFKDSIM